MAYGVMEHVDQGLSGVGRSIRRWGYVMDC
jgi:hypothetical protein